MAQFDRDPMERTSRTAIAGAMLALLAALMSMAGYLGLSAGGLDAEFAFRLFLAGVALSFISLAVSLIGLRQTRVSPGRNYAWTGIILSLLLLTPMAPHIKAAFSVPPIHDITTDTDNPPLFVDILPLRADAPNTAEYGGEAVAAMQKAAYPDIKPLILATPPAEAFARAQKLIGARGWILVSATPGLGRLEATAETRNMRFKDDIVIRITPDDAGSRIDMRSVSRFGQSDLGVNAGRIREFLKDMGAP